MSHQSDGEAPTPAVRMCLLFFLGRSFYPHLQTGQSAQQLVVLEVFYLFLAEIQLLFKKDQVSVILTQITSVVLYPAVKQTEL